MLKLKKKITKGEVMRKVIILLFVVFSINIFAGIYKVYFINGGIVVLKEKPDFSKERIIGITPDGKKIVFLKKLVDFEKTKKANAPTKEKKEKQELKSKTVNIIPPAAKSSSNKKPLIITEATVGKQNKEDKKLEKKYKPYMEWKKETFKNYSRDLPLRDVPSPVSGMNEKDAEKYWRNQFKKINSAIEQTEKEIKIVQEELNRLMTDKLNTDDNIVIMQINEDMQKLEKKKKLLEKKLNRLKKEKSDLQEKARKSGALPGWYRDLI